jgi:hypothetical protein
MTQVMPLWFQYVLLLALLIAVLYFTFVCGFLTAQQIVDLPDHSFWHRGLWGVGILGVLFICVFTMQGMAVGQISPFPWDTFSIALRRDGLGSALYFFLCVTVCQVLGVFYSRSHLRDGEEGKALLPLRDQYPSRLLLSSPHPFLSSCSSRD